MSDILIQGRVEEVQATVLTAAQQARKEQERLEQLYTQLVDFDRQAAAVILAQARAWEANAIELEQIEQRWQRVYAARCAPIDRQCLATVHSQWN